VAGVIKMVLALQHQELPPTLHADQPSPHVDWSAGDVRLLTEPVPWSVGGNRRRAGISAFGISGTNAHLIVEEAPAIAAESPDVASDPTEAAADPAGAATTVPVLASGTDARAWPVSGQSAVALAAQAGKLARWMSGHPGLDPAGVGWSLATTRSAFKHRAVIIGSAQAELAAGELAAGLSALEAGQASASLVSGAVPPGGDPGKVVFVFPGQGGQWAGMGTELAESSPVFAAKLAECATALVPYTGWNLHEVLSGADGAPGLDRVDVVQPALWAVMVSLAAVWEAAGVVPDAVAGHSQGEIAAAVVAGILSLGDAAKVVALRSRALTALSGRGAMALVAESAGAVRERLTARPGLSVAAVNGPSATVVSGDPEAVRALVSACAADGMRARVLPVDYASHGPQVAELEREITVALAEITPRPARIPMVSAMTGELLAGPEADAGYWYASLRAPVEFARSVEVLAASGHRVFVEASPRPLLTVPVTETLESLHAGGIVTGTLRRGGGGADRLLKSLAAAWLGGAAVDWAAVLPPAPTVDLPTYAFQRQHYWGSSLRALQSLRTAGPAGSGQAAAGSVAAAETRFWTAVEGGNIQELTDTLAVDGQRPFSEVLPALASWRRREQEESAVADWRYRVSWPPVSVPGLARLAGTWLLVVPGGDIAPGGDVVAEGEGQPGVTHALAARVAEVLASHGATVVVVTGGRGQPDRAVLASMLAQAVADGEVVRDADSATGGGPVTGVVSLLALDEAPLSGFAAVPEGLAGTLGLVQALGDAGVSAPLWALTRGAVAMPGEILASPVQAQTWGLGRVAALEHPDRWGGLVDVPAVLDGRSADLLCAVLAGCGEDQVAVRPAGAFGRRLERAGKPAADQARAWVPSGTVLVTGGTGAVGGHVARWLASRRAPRVILTSRSGPGSAEAAALAAALAGAGTAVTMAACDSGSREQLAGLLAGAGGSGVRAVFHAAGVTQATGLADMSAGDLAAVLAAKAGGAAYLDELTAETELDAFVLFSSGAGAWGSGLQGGYAAANAFADALATARRSRGLPAVSVAWGAWGGGGMTSPEAATALARRGVRMMDPARAVAALAQVVDAAEDQIIVTDTDWSRFAPTFTARRPSPLISGVAEARHALEDGPAEAGTRDAGLRGRLAGLPGDEQERVLTDLVRVEAASVLGHSGPGAIDPDRAFKELGFDSLTALDLRNRLNAATGLTLPSTLVYDHPSPAILARHLYAEEFGAEQAPDPLAAELDKLESLLSQATSDNEAREMVGNRLKRMLAKWNGAAAQEESQVVARKIETASDDEIINFIHAELGR
jgi:acyl transferase domain-containing protein